MNWIKTQFIRFKKWFIAVFIGGAALAVVNYDGAVLTREVNLTSTSAFTVYKYNTPDGLLHPNEYAVDELGYLVDDPQSNLYLRVDTLNKVGMTQVGIADRWGKAYIKYVDSELKTKENIEITKTEYKNLEKSKGIPSKKVNKPVTWNYVGYKLASLFKVESAYAAIALGTGANAPVLDTALSVTSLTTSFNVGTNAQKTLVVDIVVNGAISGNQTYGGETMRQVEAVTVQCSRPYTFELHDGGTPELTDGTNNIVITTAASTSHRTVGSVYNSSKDTAGNTNANGGGANASGTLSTNAAGNVVHANIAFCTATFTADQTQIADHGGDSGVYQGVQYIVKVGAGDQTMSWTSNAGGWDLLIIEVAEDTSQEVAAGKARRIIIE